MGSIYFTIALAKARKDMLTSADVEVLDYRGTADLAGVTVELNGNSPLGFYHVEVRRYVVSMLRAEEKAIFEDAMTDTVRSILTPDQKEWLDSKLATSSLSVESG